MKEIKYKSAQIWEETWEMVNKIKQDTNISFARIIHDGVGMYYQAKFLNNSENEKELLVNHDKKL